MLKYKLKFDFKLGDLFLLLFMCLGFYILSAIIFGILGALVMGFFNNPALIFIFLGLGFAIGSLGAFILLVKYIVEGIEIYIPEK